MPGAGVEKSTKSEIAPEPAIKINASAKEEQKAPSLNLLPLKIIFSNSGNAKSLDDNESHPSVTVKQPVPEVKQEQTKPPEPVIKEEQKPVPAPIEEKPQETEETINTPPPVPVPEQKPLVQEEEKQAPAAPVKETQENVAQPEPVNSAEPEVKEKEEQKSVIEKKAEPVEVEPAPTAPAKVPAPVPALIPAPVKSAASVAGVKIDKQAKKKLFLEHKKSQQAKAENQRQARMHTVVVGDNLQSLAEKYYGDKSMWVKLYDANKDKLEKGTLEAGQTILIP